MLTKNSSVKRHDVSITYTRAQGHGRFRRPRAILGVKRAGREKVKNSNGVLVKDRPPTHTSGRRHHHALHSRNTPHRLPQAPTAAAFFAVQGVIGTQKAGKSAAPHLPYCTEYEYVTPESSASTNLEA